MSLVHVAQRARRHYQLRPLPLLRPHRPSGRGTVGCLLSLSRRRACDRARLHRAPCQTSRRRQCRLFRRSHSLRQAPSVLPCVPRIWAIPRCTSQTSIIHHRWPRHSSLSAPGGHAKQLLCAESIELRLLAVPFARAPSRHNATTFHARSSISSPLIAPSVLSAAALLSPPYMYPCPLDGGSSPWFVALSGAALSPSSLRAHYDTQIDRGTSTLPLGLVFMDYVHRTVATTRRAGSSSVYCKPCNS